MANLNFVRHAHAQRLERWMGADAVARASAVTANHGNGPWYGPPIALAGVPGDVRVAPGGDFVGHVDAGYFGSGYDRAEDAIRRAARNGRRRYAEWAARQWSQAAAFPASLSDLIGASGAGKTSRIQWQKVGPTGVTSVTSSLWRVGNQPAAGAAGSAAPGGRALTNATTGAQYGLGNVSTDRRILKRMQVICTVSGQTLLMYDRIFDVAKTMNSTATESVTGVPTRYQSSTVTDDAYAGGSFCFVEVGGTALAATAHNWTVCLYRNQAGTDAQTFPSMAGNASAIVDRLDHPVSSWFMPLQTGDTGVMDLNQMQCSAAVATGLINFVIGHPICICACPIINLACDADGINDALVPVIDGAALAFLEISKPSSSASTYNGWAAFAHGA